MLPDPEIAIWLVLLGGWTAVDGTSFGQFMVSRPFVAASLAGWIVGAPAAGAVLGLVLESFHLAVLPVGAARYPEGGPAAVVASAIFTTSAQTPSLLLISVVFALAWEWVGGESVRILRQLNVRVLAGNTAVGMGALPRRHATALLLDFLRGMLLVGTGLLALAAVLDLSTERWGIGEHVPGVVLGAAVAGLFASSTRFMGARTKLYLAGALVGGLFVWAGL